MANALYPKLALTNLGKNKSTYFPYMLTSIVCIMTYYIMQSIAMNEGLMEVPGAAIAMTICGGEPVYANLAQQEESL